MTRRRPRAQVGFLGFTRRPSARRLSDSSTDDENGPKTQVVIDTMLDPHALLTPIRDTAGSIVDFTVTQVNQSVLASASGATDSASTLVVGNRLSVVLPVLAPMIDLLADVATTGNAASTHDHASSVGQERSSPTRLVLHATRVGQDVRVTWRELSSDYPVLSTHQRLAQYRAVLDSSPTGIALFDRDSRFTYVNSALCKLLGRDEDWLLTQRLPDVLDPPDSPGKGPSSRGDTSLRRVDGTRVWVAHVVTVLDSSDDNSPTYASHFFDVTDVRQTRDQLIYLASHDELTHVANRRELLACMERALDRAQLESTRVAVLFLDVDGLKHVNDTYGHAAGDQLLIDMAARLGDQVRRDDVVARLGGDEFLVCLAPATSPGDAETVAEKIHTALDRPVVVDGQTLQVSVGIGIAIAEPGETAEQVIRHADAALYRAKRSGSARTAVFDSAIDDATVADAVRTAIAGSAAQVTAVQSAERDPESAP